MPLRWPTHQHALAIAAYCLFQSSSTASAIAVYLHLPVQYNKVGDNPLVGNKAVTDKSKEEMKARMEKVRAARKNNHK